MILHLIFLSKFSANCQKVLKFSEIFRWCFVFTNFLIFLFCFLRLFGMILGSNFYVFFTVKVCLKSCFCYDFLQQILSELSKSFKIFRWYLFSRIFWFSCFVLRLFGMILGSSYYVFFAVKVCLKSCFCYDFTSHFSRQIFCQKVVKNSVIFKWCFFSLFFLVHPSMMICFAFTIFFTIFLFCFSRLFSISFGSMYVIKIYLIYC